MHFLRLLRRRGASSANGPDRFVSNDDTVEIRGCQPTEAADYLLADYVLGLTAIALLKSLADAYDHTQPGGDARLGFATDQMIVLKVVLSSLGMPDDHMRAPGIAHHERCNFAGESAFAFLSRAILRRNFDIGSFETIRDALQGRKHWRDDYFAMVGISYQRLQSHGRGDRVTNGLVHFPVSSNDRFTHKRIVLRS